MSRTDEYLDRARTALDHLRAQVDALRVQADLGEAEARDRLHQGIQQVRDLLQDARERLDQAQAASTDAWDQLAGQAEKAIDAAGDTYQRLVDEWKSATAPAAHASFDAFRTEWNHVRAECRQLLDKHDQE